MANVTYGRCTNKLRCALALNKEPIFVPLDGKCPECGQPLEVDSLSRRRLKLIPPLLVVVALIGGGYLLKKNFLDPKGGGGTVVNPTGGGGGSFARSGNAVGSVSASGDVRGGAIDKPNFDLRNDANAKARQDVLERIERMPNLTPAQKSKLTTSVDKAKSMGLILIIPFEAGKSTLGPKETDILVKATQTPSLQKLTEDPTLVLVVLGFADKQGDPKQNLKTSVDRAESVQAALKDRSGIQNVMYSVGMGGSDLFDSQVAARNRRVEVWAVFP
jgi:outer membrane protein OmpA-like peptidoglycan-associated protein